MERIPALYQGPPVCGGTFWFVRSVTPPDDGLTQSVQYTAPSRLYYSGNRAFNGDHFFSSLLQSLLRLCLIHSHRQLYRLQSPSNALQLHCIMFLIHFGENFSYLVPVHIIPNLNWHMFFFSPALITPFS